MAFTRQTPNVKRQQPGLQADGIQQVFNQVEFYDANGALNFRVDPWGNVYSAGSLANFRTVNANTTVVGAETDGFPDEVIIVNTNNKQVTLPTPSASNLGQVITVKNIGSGVNSTTVVGTIDGATNYTLSANFKFVTVMSSGDGTNWYILGNN